MKTEQQRYRMVALDVDGTIAGPDFGVPDETKHAIAEVVGAGAVVVVATGRMRRSALEYARICGTNGPVICYQGALTVAADGVTDLHHERLGRDIVEAALSRMRSAGAHINVYLDDEIYVEKPTAWAEAYAGRMGVELQVVASLDEVSASGPTVVMSVDEPANTAQMADSLRGLLGGAAAVTQSLSRFCEVTSPAAGKHLALERLAGQLGIPASQVIAAGDGQGDAGMLRWAGLGVAVESAHPHARSAAGTIVADPGRNGVGNLLRDLLRQGKLGR